MDTHSGDEMMVSKSGGKSELSKCLPFVAPEDPLSNDVPFLGLLNPGSGNQSGKVILDEAKKCPCFAGRFFNIIDVAIKPDVAKEFRKRLEQVKEETNEKILRQPNLQWRPRLIVGGGDGTASFAIWCIFNVLRKEGGGFEWSDNDLSSFFPAFAQLPLGTGNDFAGVLGWGRTIDPAGNAEESRTWFTEALKQSRPVRPFDVWGIFPRGDRKMKVCMFAGIDKVHPDRPKFEEAGPSVPFLSLLYFSLGYDAFVASRVECNRMPSRIGNGLEYIKSGVSSLVGAERKNNDLTGVTATVPDGDSSVYGGVGTQYFPPLRDGDAPENSPRSPEDAADHSPRPDFRAYSPRPDPPFCSTYNSASTSAAFSKGLNGSDPTRTVYECVGAMNINSISGGVVSAATPARFDDGLLDLYRQKNFFGNIQRRNQYNTEKHSRVSFNIPHELAGVFCQSDGEARFLFHPDGEEVKLEVRRVMQIPVVLGPKFHGAEKEDAFAAREKVGADNFCFTGDGNEALEFRERFDAWVKGDLTEELNGTAEQVAQVERRASLYAQGVCERSQRVWMDFGQNIKSIVCASCAKSSTWGGNKGCSGCRKIFCFPCFQRHRGTSANVTWRYGDVGLPLPFASALAKKNSLRYSAMLSIDDAIKQMSVEQTARSGRPITLKIWVIKNKAENQEQEHNCSCPLEARTWLEAFRENDRLVAETSFSAAGYPVSGEPQASGFQLAAAQP